MCVHHVTGHQHGSVQLKALCIRFLTQINNLTLIRRPWLEPATPSLQIKVYWLLTLYLLYSWRAVLYNSFGCMSVISSIHFFVILLDVTCTVFNFYSFCRIFLYFCRAFLWSMFLFFMHVFQLSIQPQSFFFSEERFILVSDVFTLFLLYT